MSVLKSIAFGLIVALLGATTMVMDMDAAQDPAAEMTEIHCDACPDTMNDEAAAPHAGSCASGASCMMTAVGVDDRPILIERVARHWANFPEDHAFVSTDPLLDLPPPRG